jgi:hypothetical protein
MNIEIELSFEIVGAEFAKANRMRKSVADLVVEEGLRHGFTY